MKVVITGSSKGLGLSLAMEFLLEGDQVIISSRNESDIEKLQSTRIFNILAEKPETVAKFLVPRIKEIKGSGKSIRYLTRKGIMWRFFTANKRKNKFFDEKGNPVS